MLNAEITLSCEFMKKCIISCGKTCIRCKENIALLFSISEPEDSKKIQIKRLIEKLTTPI